MMHLLKRMHEDLNTAILTLTRGGERQASVEAQSKAHELAVQGREDKLNGIVNGYQKMIADLRIELKIAKESANKFGLEKQALERELKQLKKGSNK